ncbi:MAG: hypothetical protein ABI388_13275 [Bacteroidia bacterium]
MQDKKPYRIDEIALREKFANYQVSFNPACLEILENEVAHVKTHSSLELPDTKKIIRFIAIPVVLIVLGCVAFFTYNYIQNLPATEPIKDTTVVSKPIIEPKIEAQPTQEIKPAVVAVDTIKAEIAKRDTVIEVSSQKVKSVAKTISTQKNNNSKRDTNRVAKINSIQVDSVSKKNNGDTTATTKNRDTTTKKKKKKRKNSLDATDDIRQSTPNSADEDVVVPNN